MNGHSIMNPVSELEAADYERTPHSCTSCAIGRCSDSYHLAARRLADALAGMLTILGSDFVHVEVATQKEAAQMIAATEAARSALRKAGRLP